MIGKASDIIIHQHFKRDGVGGAVIFPNFRSSTAKTYLGLHNSSRGRKKAARVGKKEDLAFLATGGGGGGTHRYISSVTKY